VGLVERALSTIITPLMAIFLAQEVGTALAGLLILLSIGVAVLASLAGGLVADRYGRRVPLLIGTAGTALAFAGMAVASSSLWHSAIGVFGFYVVNVALSNFALPANEAMIVDVTSSEQRKGVYTLQYWSVNVALALGALVGGFLYSGYFAAMLAIAAGIAAVAALVSLRFLTETIPGRAADRDGALEHLTGLLRGYQEAVRAPMFRRVVLGMTVWLGLEMQLTGYVAVRLAEDMPDRQQFLAIGSWPLNLNGVELLGILRAENTLLIVLLALFSERLLRRLPDPPRVYIGIALFAIGTATLAVSSVVGALVLAVAVLTLGELMHIPVMQAMVADLVPEDARTRYLALFKLSIQGGMIIAAIGLTAGAVIPPAGMAVAFIALAALIVGLYRPVLARRGAPTVSATAPRPTCFTSDRGREVDSMRTTQLRGVHVVVLNRWRDKYARYADYLDHQACRVTYVTTTGGVKAVPEEAAAVVIVDDLCDFAAVRAAIEPAVSEHGKPEAVVALQEGDFLVASSLREEFASRGRKPAELHHFLDKHAMLLAAQRAGVRVPRFELVTEAQDICAFATRVGWPVVVKPLLGRASTGVRRLDNPDDGACIDVSRERPMVAQEYLPYPVYHVDGIFTGDDLGPWRLSAYENVPGAATTGPLAFMLGEPVGSIEVDDPAMCATVEGFLRRLLPGMSTRPWVFHLELFIVPAFAGRECVFLEVGCRPGGGDIPFVWREVHNVDLMGLEFALQCDETPDLAPFPADEPVGGCLLVPLQGAPCRVVAANSMLGKEGPYAEVIPHVGVVIPRTEGSYELIGGRFRYGGLTSAEVTRKVLATAAEYELRCEPVEDIDSVTVGRS
jgi:DHA1 family multidrug resistance protein B-like MFS transporter